MLKLPITRCFSLQIVFKQSSTIKLNIQDGSEEALLYKLVVLFLKKHLHEQ
jgi:hypothetical protein